jgi:hypothetical protein
LFFGDAEEHFFEVRAFGQFGESLADFSEAAINDLAAVLQYQNVRTDFFQQMEQVRADEDRRAFASAFEN